MLCCCPAPRYMIASGSAEVLHEVTRSCPDLWLDADGFGASLVYRCIPKGDWGRLEGFLQALPASYRARCIGQGLVHAAERGSEDGVSVLLREWRELSRGPPDTSAVAWDSNFRAKSAAKRALGAACADGNATIVEMLVSFFLEHSTIEEGGSAADASEPVASWPTTRIGPWQRTEVLSLALNTAATHDHPQLVKLLQRSDPHTCAVVCMGRPGRSEAPLIVAARKGNEAAVRELLALGPADQVLARDAEGSIALINAIKGGHTGGWMRCG